MRLLLCSVLFSSVSKNTFFCSDKCLCHTCWLYLCVCVCDCEMENMQRLHSSDRRINFIFFLFSSERSQLWRISVYAHFLSLSLACRDIELLFAIGHPRWPLLTMSWWISLFRRRLFKEVSDHSSLAIHRASSTLRIRDRLCQTPPLIVYSQGKAGSANSGSSSLTFHPVAFHFLRLSRIPHLPLPLSPSPYEMKLIFRRGKKKN